MFTSQHWRTAMRAILGVALLLRSFVALAQTCDPLHEYDEITSTVTEQFYDKTYNGLDWGARVSAYRHDVDCSDGATELAVVVNRLLAELHASHTALFTAADLDYWGLNSFFGQFESLDAYPLYFTGIW